MGRYSFGKGIAGPRTAAEIRADDKASAQQARIRAARMDDKQKVHLLARGIKQAAIRSAAVTIADLTQTGVSEADSHRLYDKAMQLALHCDPAIAQVTA